jgi:uncharacterized protein (TIGR02246 family)
MTHLSVRPCALAVALLTAVAVQADAPPASGDRDASAEAEIRALEQKWVEAELRRDAAAVAELIDDQFLIVFGAGKPIDKAQFVKAVPSFTSTSQVLSEQIVRVAGDTAISIGRDTAEGIHHDGSHYTETARYTATYIKRQGHWRALAEHMVKEEPSPR